MTRAGGLYLHIPFCKQKCGYCDFASFAGIENQIDNYLIALKKEAAQHSGARFDTLYIGGGTPSLLSVEQLKKLFEIKLQKRIKTRLSKELHLATEAGTGYTSR